MGMNPRLLRPRQTGFDPRQISGLVAYWPMEEVGETTNASVLDASGNGFALTSFGALPDPGRQGYGRLLSATGSQWNPSPARLTRGLQNATPAWDANATGWAVAFWLKTDLSVNSTGTASTAANISFESAAGGNMQHVRFSGGTPATGFPTLSTRCYFSDGSFTGGIFTGNLSDTAPQGQWTHFAFVANPAALTYTVYRNGVALLSSSYAAGKVIADFSSGIPCTIQWPGVIDEVVVYSRVLTVSEVGRLAGVPSRPAAASTLHPDCRSWISRVLSAGGSVSSTTAAAVSQFCVDIENAGIRDRFYRLNLFCGNSDASLAAVRTPLYRGPSLGGTQFGNAIDTNNNFVAGDYAETGASGGLTGNGSTKSLDTGVNLLFSTPTDTHLAAYERAISTGNDRALIGADALGSTPRSIYALYQLNPSVTTYYDGTTTAALSYSAARLAGFWVGSNQAASRDLFFNGSSVQAMPGPKPGVGSSATQTYRVFAFQTGANVSGFHSGRIAGYSLGFALNAAQALAYYNAMQAFQTALGRQV